MLESSIFGAQPVDRDAHGARHVTGTPRVLGCPRRPEALPAVLGPSADIQDDRGRVADRVLHCGAVCEQARVLLDGWVSARGRVRDVGAPLVTSLRPLVTRAHDDPYVLVAVGLQQPE